MSTGADGALLSFLPALPLDSSVSQFLFHIALEFCEANFCNKPVLVRASGFAPSRRSGGVLLIHEVNRTRAQWEKQADISMDSWRVGVQERCKSSYVGCWSLRLILGIHSERLLYTPAVGATIFVTVVIFSVVSIVGWYKKERVIKYTVTVPNPPGDGRVMEKPSIKVLVGQTEFA